MVNTRSTVIQFPAFLISHSFLTGKVIPSRVLIISLRCKVPASLLSLASIYPVILCGSLAMFSCASITRFMILDVMLWALPMLKRHETYGFPTILLVSKEKERRKKRKRKGIALYILRVVLRCCKCTFPAVIHSTTSRSLLAASQTGMIFVTMRRIKTST